MKIYVGNLSREITDAQLHELGAPFGTLSASNVARKRDGGESKGFGFLEFADVSEANAAIAGLNGKEVGGQRIKVSEAAYQTQSDRIY